MRGCGRSAEALPPLLRGFREARSVRSAKIRSSNTSSLLNATLVIDQVPQLIVSKFLRTSARPYNGERFEGIRGSHTKVQGGFRLGCISRIGFHPACNLMRLTIYRHTEGGTGANGIAIVTELALRSAGSTDEVAAKPISRRR